MIPSRGVDSTMEINQCIHITFQAQRSSQESIYLASERCIVCLRSNLTRKVLLNLEMNVNDLLITGERNAY